MRMSVLVGHKPTKQSSTKLRGKTLATDTDRLTRLLRGRTSEDRAGAQVSRPERSGGSKGVVPDEEDG